MSKFPADNFSDCKYCGARLLKEGATACASCGRSQQSVSGALVVLAIAIMFLVVVAFTAMSGSSLSVNIPVKDEPTLTEDQRIKKNCEYIRFDLRDKPVGQFTLKDQERIQACTLVGY